MIYCRYEAVFEKGNELSEALVSMSMHREGNGHKPRCVPRISLSMLNNSTSTEVKAAVSLRHPNSSFIPLVARKSFTVVHNVKFDILWDYPDIQRLRKREKSRSFLMTVPEHFLDDRLDHGSKRESTVREATNAAETLWGPGTKFAFLKFPFSVSEPTCYEHP